MRTREACEEAAGWQGSFSAEPSDLAPNAFLRLHLGCPRQPEGNGLDHDLNPGNNRGWMHEGAETEPVHQETHRRAKMRPAQLRAITWLFSLSPGWSVAAGAAFAVVLSAFPVVFMGKSYVSPNYGTPLLHGSFPALPGYENHRTSRVMGSDVGAIMWAHLPYSMMQHRALLEDGEFPFWNRYNSAGLPLLGQGQSMLGDPLHLIVIAANGAAWAWDLKYLFAKFLLASGLGWLVFGITGRREAGLIMALAAPFAGFFVFRVNHPAFFSFCYAPWPLYGWLRCSRANTVRSYAAWAALCLLANLALMNSGTVKEAYMLLVAMNFSGACLLLAEQGSWRARAIKLAGLAWAGGAFVLATAPFWMTFLTTLQAAFTTSDAVGANQLPPSLLLGVFDEVLFRVTNADGAVFNPSANFLVLAGILCFLATWRRQLANRAAVGLALSSLVPFGLVFGLVPPSWIVRVPFLANVIHIDSTFLCALIVLWSVLGGAGFAAIADCFRTQDGRRELGRMGIMLGILVLGFAGFCLGFNRGQLDTGAQLAPLSAYRFAWGYLTWLVVAVIVLGFLSRRALRRGWMTRGELVMVALCTFALLGRMGLQAQAGFTRYTVRGAPRVDLHAVSGAVAFVQERVRLAPARVIGLEADLYAGWTGTYALEGISGPDALMAPHYRELALASPLLREWDWRFYLSADRLASARRFLDFLNVRHYFIRTKDAPAAVKSGLALCHAADFEVYESTTAWPRAFFTNHVTLYNDVGQLADQIQRGDGRPFAAVRAQDLPKSNEIPGLPTHLASRTVVAATDYRLTENTTSFELTAPARGIVVLGETNWRGYSTAEIDGRPVNVWRVNHVFQGIAVEPGLHRVTFRYQPENWDVALKLSITGLGLLLASGAIAWRAGRRSV